MTGFGASEGTLAGGLIRVEIRSVNHRYFLVSVKSPPEFQSLESQIRDRLREDFARGHLTVSIRWLEGAPTKVGPQLRLDVERAREAMARLRELQTAVGLNAEITLELVARQPEVFVAVEPTDAQLEWTAIEPILARAAAECRAMREREGLALVAELSGRLEALRAGRRTVEQRAPERLVRERDRLRAQVAELVDGRPIDDQRLSQELAFLADRLDITEELVRLGAHLDACGSALDGDRPVGKQLGFLAQELGREVNTIGSKANDAVIQHTVVEMKGELERFREQLENLE
ncbi:MAG: YicC/YloC family endoribonuclease [Gemmatimonadales bacterium]